LDDLYRYRWSGHSAIMGERDYPWMDAQYVLARFGKRKAAGRRGYRRFMGEGVGIGRVPELTGGGGRGGGCADSGEWRVRPGGFGVVGRVPVDRVPYVVDTALQLFAGLKHVILVGAKPPVGFFAYPGKPSLMAPQDCAIHVLARPEQDAVAALQWLADEIGSPRIVSIKEERQKPCIASGSFDSEAFGVTLAALLPENAIVADDAVTSGRAVFPNTFNASPHDWIQSTGGAIGHGFPCATGAAVACPDRKVVCLQADGAGMYTLQALWTQAREKLDVVNVVFANRVYKILYGELRAGGATPGPASDTFFDLGRPDLDWVGLARGMGVEAVRVETLEGFADTFRAACGHRGPFLIEFRI